MVALGIYVLVPDADRRKELRNAHQSGRLMAEAVPEFWHKRSDKLLCLLALEQGSYSHVAWGKRGQRGGTERRRLNFERCQRISNLPQRAIVQTLEKRNREDLAERFREGGHIPDGDVAEVREVLQELSPQIADIIDEEIGDLEIAERLPPNAREVLAIEQEATYASMRWAGLDPLKEVKWSLRDHGRRRITSFLDGLGSRRMLEDDIIRNDMHTLPGWDLELDRRFDGVKFVNDWRKLYVLHANAQPLERTFGADLIYYNFDFDCFIMVQYKVMEGDEGKEHFRFPNEQLDAELKRMKDALDEFSACRLDPTCGAFRLNDNPFFMKFCIGREFDPENDALFPGFYVPLGYWDLLSKSSTTLGSRGGRFISKHNAERYITNSAFLHVVQGAWVGTTPSQSALLARLIHKILKENRSLTLAAYRTLEE